MRIWLDNASPEEKASQSSAESGNEFPHSKFGNNPDIQRKSS
jgi:hypothetical protein